MLLIHDEGCGASSEGSLCLLPCQTLQEQSSVHACIQATEIA